MHFNIWSTLEWLITDGSIISTIVPSVQPTRTSSVFNSFIPCRELCESLFTAISRPSERIPYTNKET
ncbi:hypothetical protein U9M48_015442 [Paspalum notatum var. saurae]|uniref:Uncharacterized protein n=1 Tax=Paspalum notatum var. saurae TaxID=547442 RepID=A0AAQ3T4H0_PASNO